MQSIKKSTLIQIFIFLGISAGLIYWQYMSMDKAQLAEMEKAFSQVHYIYSLPITMAIFFSHLFRSLRWKLLLEPLDIKPATSNTLFAVLIGYLINSLIPRLGEVVKCSVLTKYENAPFEKTLGSIISERIFDMICLGLVFVIVLLTQYNIFGTYAITLFQKVFYNDEGVFIWLRILLAFTIIVLSILVAFLIYRKIKNNKLGKIITRFKEGVQSILNVKQKGLFIFYTFLIWLMYATISLLGFYMIPATAHLGWLAALAIISFGSIAVIITPGGLGAYPPVVASILFLYHIDKPIGIAYGWVTWSIQTVVVIGLGLLSLIFLPIFNRNKK